MHMSLKARFYPESRFGGFSDVDDTVAFYSRVNALLPADAIVLDVGCGRGAAADDPVPYRRSLRILKGKAARVIGLDVDPAAQDNPLVDEVRPIDGPRWPVEDGSISLLLCDHVMEHLPDPDQFFAEARRVLAIDGHLCLRTPNAWGYVALGARLIPDTLHGRVLSLLQPGRQRRDIFPTLYRCNSLATLRAAMARHGFDGVAYGYGSEPSYLTRFPLAYAAGVLLHRLLPRSLQSTLCVFAVRRT